MKERRERKGEMKRRNENKEKEKTKKGMKKRERRESWKLTTLQMSSK